MKNKIESINNIPSAGKVSEENYQDDELIKLTARQKIMLGTCCLVLLLLIAVSGTVIINIVDDNILENSTIMLVMCAITLIMDILAFTSIKSRRPKVN